ncbi:hypothetical protein [Paenibacillus sp. GCM10027626]|uniref:hypothetical protein n=1 Tax=Paenibacillus sp. GCM10027626 TaxID=3273411 RepID=UPI00363FDE5D
MSDSNATSASIDLNNLRHDPIMNDFFNEAIWGKAWKNHGDTIVNKMKKAGIAPAKAIISDYLQFSHP